MRSRKTISILIFPLMAVLALVANCKPLTAKNPDLKQNKKNPAPTLYLCKSDTNSTETVPAEHKIFRKMILEKVPDPNLADQTQFNLVVAVHGWFEFKPWPRDLAVAINNKIDPNEWFCGWLDWRKNSKVINPADAAIFAREKGGPFLGQKIVELSKNWRHVHLIGHSSGAWLISEAAKIIAEQTDASIHLTFLDAYVPLLWKQSQLGDFPADPNTIYWADHYIIHDITFSATGQELTNAHNVDITVADPGIADHDFVRHWYHATVAGRYKNAWQYENKKLLTQSDTTDYGFARSLEAGADNFKASTELELGNKAVKIIKPKTSFDKFFENLFKNPKK